MSIFDEIAKGGTARPLAAFMVGRENRRQRERQEQIDELNEEFKRKQLEQADERIGVAKERNELIAAQAESEARAAAAAAQEKQLQSIQMAKSIFDNPNIPKEKKSQAIGMIMSGSDKGIQEALDLIQDELKPNRIQQTQEVPYNAKQLNTAAIESAQSSGQLRRNLTSTLPELAANKGSVGIRGKLGGASGAIGTFFLGEAAGNQIAKMIANNDQEGIASIQARLSQIRAQLIPIVSGEQSGRFSEGERAIANRTVSVIDSLEVADLAKGYPQVVGALKELTIASLENEFEQALASDAVKPPFDLSTPEGALSLLDELEALGLDKEARKAGLKRLKKIYDAQ